MKAKTNTSTTIPIRLNTRNKNPCFADAYGLSFFFKNACSIYADNVANPSSAIRMSFL